MPSILGANTLSSGYDVANSLRFNSGSSDRLNKTLGTPTNNLKFTYSFWIKRSKLGEEVAVTEAINNSQNKALILFRSDDQLEILDLQSDSYVMQKKTSRKFRDTSAWYHIVFSNDSTVGSPDLKLYVNGVEETSWATDNEYSQNEASLFNSALANHIGASASSRFINCYFSEFVFIDGQALAADQFGEFDSDSPTIWKPKDVSGLTFGDNGFYFEFKGSGTDTDANGMGADTSGNTNHFAVNNLTAVDQTTDTCTNNFATLNFNNGTGTRTQNDNYSEGATIVIPSNHDNYTTTFATMGAKNGKWYWEAQSIVEGTANNAYYPRTIGIMTDNNPLTTSTLGQDQFSWDVVYNGGNWDASHNGSVVVNDMSTDRTSGNILQFALDLDNGKFYFGIGGTYLNSGDPTTGSTGTGAIHTLSAADLDNFIIPAVTNATTGTYYKFNFGNPAFSISSGNADANGYGNFEYAPPSGYFAWCTKNLAENG